MTSQSDAILVLDQLSALTADLTLEDDARVEARIDPDGPSGPLAVEGVVGPPLASDDSKKTDASATNAALVKILNATIIVN